MEARNRIILALDVDSAERAERLVGRLQQHVGAFKVGLELVNAEGIGVLDRLRRVGAERIFYDAKLHDIPNTVAGAVRALARQRIWMLNVHAAGGTRMVRAAAEALRQVELAPGVSRPILLAVTLLTSIGADELEHEMHVELPPAEYVADMARMAREAGAQGVVASAREVAAIRGACGSEFVIVTPGVRPAGSEAGDQKRTVTPAEAVRLGSDYLVIGRPITGAHDPVEAARRIAAEIEAAA